MLNFDFQHHQILQDDCVDVIQIFAYSENAFIRLYKEIPRLRQVCEDRVSGIVLFSAAYKLRRPYQRKTCVI